MRKAPSHSTPRASREAGFVLTDVLLGLITAFRNPRLWPVLLAACSYEPVTNHVSWSLDGGTQSCNGACYDRSVDLAERNRRGIEGRPGVEEIELWACQPGTARDVQGNSIGDEEQVSAGEGLCAPREEFDCKAARADQRAQVDVPIIDPDQREFQPPAPTPADAGALDAGVPGDAGGADGGTGDAGTSDVQDASVPPAPQSPVIPIPGPTTCAEACRQQDPPLDCNFGVTPGGGRRLPSQPLRPGDTAVCFGETPPGVQCP